MRMALATLVIGLLATSAQADAIHFEQIPSDISGYVHIDVERFLASHMCHDLGDETTKTLPAQFDEVFGGSVSSILVYMLTENDDAVLIVRVPNQKVRSRIEASKDSIAFTYESEKVFYSPQGILGGSAFNAQIQTQHGASAPKAENHNSFSIGMGVGDEHALDRWIQGPSYYSFIGPDLIVTTTQLPSIAHAIDVLHGKKPSLVDHDPQALKIDAPPGVILVGAGLTLGIDANNLNNTSTHPADSLESTTRPIKVTDSGASGFGFDLFGSLEGKARLARVNIGEDDHNLYIDALIGMVDPESATQLKNLTIGVKALISLSQADQKPLIDPLDISASGNNVVLRWTWQTTKLPELHKLLYAGQSTHENESRATTTRATMPAH